MPARRMICEHGTEGSVVATLQDFFNNDFPHDFIYKKTFALELAPPNDPTTFNHLADVIGRLHYNFASGALYISYYIPQVSVPIMDVLVWILNKTQEILNYRNAVQVEMGFVGERKIPSSELHFTGRIYLYSETDVPDNDFEKLRIAAQKDKLFVSLRGRQFAVERSKLEKPLAFISHDFRDKDAVAGPIAMGLSNLLCPVWYDEYSLKVGDRLRESIERGIRECEKSVIVLSHNFLNNPGWSKVEFNSIFTREIIETKDVVLPVWVDVTKEQVFEYCPSLVDRLAVQWARGVEVVVRELYRAIVR
jgi:hypothetical protein